MFRFGLVGAIGALVLTATPAAAAKLITIDFVVGPWSLHPDAPEPPYGLDPSAVLTGSFTVDADLQNPMDPGSDTLVAIDFTTGTRTWTLAELIAEGTTGIVYVGDTITQFRLAVDSFNVVTTQFNSAYLADGFDYENFMSCRDCLTWSVRGAGIPGGAVPEPATWALMISGFGLAGSTLRQRRRSLTA